ncbi:MAG: tRNA (N6-isopentenyl adenosine(37)-C2)-methylthiotransferase MiaB [Candidatus Aureabacteria bacterium]|nr:tRNA (N6-isopentenyl adenosine(37)-C2)-methylthiotransferase MiaB [Candidatus Auribacterota bacterium]
MNEYDSLAMRQLLQEKGFEDVENMDEADIVILETCSVRQKAEDKVFGMIGKLSARRRTTGLPVIIVAGCMAERMKQDLLKKFPQVDIIIGPGHIQYIAEKTQDVLQNFSAGKTAMSVLGFETDRAGETYHKGLYNGIKEIKAFVTVIRGCANYCSYCIVPYVRGPEQSRPYEEILTEISELMERGVKEITLLGQNINIYGKDLDPPISFPELLKKIIAIDSFDRVRFVTTHPKDTRAELIELMAGEEKLMPYLHMPFQSGSDRILKKMNRKYTREEYMKKIESFRKIYPGLSITTDIIVGFPGESEEDYEQTKDMVQKIQFDSAFIFKYSDRSGTRAAEEKEKVPESIIVRRHSELLALQNEITLKKNKAMEGQMVHVLVEGESKTNPTRLTGRTEQNKIAVFEKNNTVKAGDIIKVKVATGCSHSLYCKILK